MDNTAIATTIIYFHDLWFFLCHILEEFPVLKKFLIFFYFELFYYLFWKATFSILHAFFLQVLGGEIIKNY